MKVEILKPVMVSVLPGTIAEVTERQYKALGSSCKKVEEAKKKTYKAAKEKD